MSFGEKKLKYTAAISVIIYIANAWFFQENSDAINKTKVVLFAPLETPEKEILNDKLKKTILSKVPACKNLINFDAINLEKELSTIFEALRNRTNPRNYSKTKSTPNFIKICFHSD